MLVIFRVMSPPEASTKAKVCQLDVTIGINQNIVRFDISMDKSHLVNTINCTNQLTDVEPEGKN